MLYYMDTHGGGSGMASLKREFDYYLRHQDEIVSEHDGKVVAIKNERVIGVYDSELEAILSVQEDHEVGTFIVQRVSEGPDDYTHTFHSRVEFAE